MKRPHSACKCNEYTTMGGYQNQVSVCDMHGRWVCIDRCILPDIIELWMDHAIDTIESCCGHHQTEGYIAVHERYYDDMIRLGYVRHPRAVAHNRKDLWLWPRVQQQQGGA